MSDDSNQDEAKLNLDASEKPEGDAGAASTTSNATEKVNGEGEESATLDLKDSDKESGASGSKSTAVLNKEKQIESWANRYYNGDVTLEEVPKWIQKEIEIAESSKESVDETIERKLEEKESDKRFISMQQKLNKRGLKKSEVDAITSEYTENRKYGMPKDVAFLKALKLAGVTLDAKQDDNSDKSEKRKAMQLPQQGKGVKESSFNEAKPYSEVREQLSQEDRIAALTKLRDRPIK